MLGCKKDDPNPSTSGDFISGTTWTSVSADFDIEVETLSGDLTDNVFTLYPCLADNVYAYKADGTYEELESAKICSGMGAKYTGTWSLSSDKKTLTVMRVNGTFKDTLSYAIQSHNDTIFVADIKKSVPLDPEKVNAQFTFKKKPAPAAGAAVLATVAITSITQNSATSGGTISSGGSSEISAKGVCWSTTANPTVALATKTSDGTGSTSFTSQLTGLSPNKTYYVRAYATNATGTSYGEEVSFKTTLHPLAMGLVGKTWKITDYTFGGISQFSSYEFCEKDNTFLFNSNGTYLYKENFNQCFGAPTSATLNFTVSGDGSQFYFKQDTYYNLTVTATTMTFTSDAGGTTKYIYTAQ